MILIEKIENYLKKDDFFGYQQIHEIDTKTHRYVWGGCLVNKDTGIIDRYINKANTAVGVVEYRECIWGDRESYEIYVAGKFMGYITRDYKFQAPMCSGGDYWLTGITTSYSILKEKEENERIKKENHDKEMNDMFKDLFKNDRD